MKPIFVVAAGLMIAIASACADDSSLKEKISEFSPNKKFAVRTSYDPAVDDGSGDEIRRDAIKSIDVVAMPEKKIVANLVEDLKGEDIGSMNTKVIWSPDSKWFAFGVSGGHRVTMTSVFHWKGDKFESLGGDEITVPAGGDPRNQYVTPVRWLKPGTLVLEQFTIFMYGKGDSTFRFTVRFDENGKFHVIDKKRVKSQSNE